MRRNRSGNGSVGSLTARSSRLRRTTGTGRNSRSSFFLVSGSSASWVASSLRSMVAPDGTTWPTALRSPSWRGGRGAWLAEYDGRPEGRRLCTQRREEVDRQRVLLSRGRDLGQNRRR